MSPIRNVVICSAGVGSRLGLDMPKCLAPIEGRPLIHWQLDLLQDIENVIIVVGYQASQVMKAVLEKRPDAIFAVNHEYLTTNTLDSMLIGISRLEEPFIYLDGDLLVDSQAIGRIAEAPCPCIGIKRTYSEQPVCVKLGTGKQAGLVVGFTRELLEYEWTGLAKLNPHEAKAAKGAQYVYHAVERVLPVAAVEIDCVEIDTKRDLEEARLWMKDQALSSDFGKSVAVR